MTFRTWLGMERRVPRRRTPAQFLSTETLESRCLLSPLGKSSARHDPAEISEGRSVPRTGFPTSTIGSATFNVALSWIVRAGTPLTGTMQITASDDKSYTAHFSVPGAFECDLHGKAKFGQISGISGKAVDAESGKKIKFNTTLTSIFHFEGTVKAGKMKGTIEGTAPDLQPHN